MFNLLDSRSEHHDFAGFSFMFQPSQDPIAWLALKHYASITPNVAQKQALLVWLREHPCPGVPVVEQMEMGL